MNAQQLRNSILQEAIEGRLVSQDPNDEPASVLLERIREEKKRLVKEGKLKKKDLEEKPVSEDEKPFEIPDSWEWVRLGEISTYANTKKKINAAQANPNLWGLDLEDIEKGGRLLSLKSVGERKAIGDKTCFSEGDILYSKLRPYLLKILIAPKDGICTPEIIPFTCYGCICKEYIVYLLKSAYVDDYINSVTFGIKMPRVSTETMVSLVIPLPPLAEQKRIVAKIEELLPKVEEYGKAQEALDKLNEELPEKLKKSVLQEAITGKIVPQDPNDEPASVLLNRIREEKKRLVKEGKLKKKDLEETPINEDEKPFEIPESWEWCRLGDIGLFERGNGIKRDETFESGYPCVRYGEMYTKYKYAPTFEKTVSFTCKSVFEKCRKAHKGDLFMALTGENKQDISLAAQYVGDKEIAVGGDLCHFTILEAYGLYFVYLINSKYFSSKKELLATGDIIVHISTDKLASIPIPLPPLAEQKRIVEKLEQLLGEIDKLNNN